MRKVIIAGVSAVALGFAGTALAAGNSSSMNSSEGTSAQSSSQSMDQSQVKQVQQKLKSAGLYKGKVDGREGPETMAALKKYQQQNGLPATGRLDAQTEMKLGVGSEESGSSTNMHPHAVPNQPQGKPSITGGGAGTTGQGANGTQK